MPDWPLLQSHPLLFLLGLLLLVSFSVPLPVSPALIIAGALTTSGKLSMPLVLLLSPLALVPGDAFWYFLGRRLGHRIVDTVCLISLSRDACIQKTQLTLKRFNLRAFLIGRFIPGFGIVAPPIAGATRQPFLGFMGYNLLGTCLYTTLMLALGFLFADQLARILALLESAGRNITHLAIAAIVLYIAWKALSRYWFAWRLGLPPLHANHLIQSGTPFHFFDLRTSHDLEKFPFVIPGAKRHSETEIEAILKDVPATTFIILFCYCPNQATSTQVARHLRRKGFKRAFSLRGGIHAWQNAGLPLEPHAMSGHASGIVQLGTVPAR